MERDAGSSEADLEAEQGWLVGDGQDDGVGTGQSRAGFAGSVNEVRGLGPVRKVGADDAVVIEWVLRVGVNAWGEGSNGTLRMQGLTG
jgi:hypothetical protein